jgi:hypothetical protein
MNADSAFYLGVALARAEAMHLKNIEFHTSIVYNEKDNAFVDRHLSDYPKLFTEKIDMGNGNIHLKINSFNYAAEGA